MIRPANCQEDAATYSILGYGVQGRPTDIHIEAPSRDAQDGSSPGLDNLTTSSNNEPNRRQSKKRQRPSETRMPFPRKRAFAACQLCRSRKVRSLVLSVLVCFADCARPNVTTSVLLAGRVLPWMPNVYIKMRIRISRR